MKELEYYKKLSDLQKEEIQLLKEMATISNAIIVELKDTIQLLKIFYKYDEK